MQFNRIQCHQWMREQQWWAFPVLCQPFAANASHSSIAVLRKSQSESSLKRAESSDVPLAAPTVRLPSNDGSHCIVNWERNIWNDWLKLSLSQSSGEHRLVFDVNPSNSFSNSDPIFDVKKVGEHIHIVRNAANVENVGNDTNLFSLSESVRSDSNALML